ncbi:uncharacterized protein LOC111621196, partial [Centruroides sculpturatus]|uniref:uncharacterized protein LOC111621196 n=1 Tax=Centruroides sculpturatus TaxID=218467 RepID=UPI000C6D514F
MIIQSLIKGEYFRQKDGISMGSVVGPKLAEIVMKNIDKTLLNLGGIVFLARTTRSEKRIEELKKINKKYLLNNYPKRLLRNWYDEYSKRRFQVKQQKESKKYVSFPYIQGIFE